MPLDYDLEYRLRFKGEEELQHKSLYRNAVVEVDDRGQQVGQDMIPWVWTLSFSAIELSVSDQLSYEDHVGARGEAPGRKIGHRYGIHAKLKPGHSRQRPWDHTTFRLFGTNRVLQEITLDIRPVSEPEDEGCTAWATASYAADIDVRNEIQPDCLCFYMMVSQAVYDRYLWNIAQGLVNEVILSLGFVDGFYAQWSPEVSTREVKILAGEEHKVDGAEGLTLSRLGKIGKVELAMNAVGLINKRTAAVELGADDEPDEEVGGRQGFRWPGRR